jgi:erythromycin esterase-like protein
VTAASDWDGAAEFKAVHPSLGGSYERVLHDAALERFLLLLREPSAVGSALMEPRLERAIGVIYRPESERLSHYFTATLPEQFDAVIHVDVTSAVQPLERATAEQAAEPPETYPSGV